MDKKVKKQKSFSRNEQIFLKQKGNRSNHVQLYREIYKTKTLSDKRIKQRIERILKKEKLLSQRPSLNRNDTGCYIPLDISTISVSNVQEHQQEQVSFAKERISNMLAEAYAKAAEDPKGASAMISATLAIAKLNGHLSDKNDVEIAALTEKESLLQEVEKARQRLQAHKMNTSENKFDFQPQEQY